MVTADSVTERAKGFAERRRRGFRVYWAPIAIALLAAGGWGVYRGTVIYVRSSYESRCRMAREKGDWTALEALASQWTRWQADRAPPWLYAAEAAEEQQRHVQAAAYLEQLPDDDPKTPPALLKLVDLYFGPLNQPLSGAATCQRLLRIDSACGAAHQRLTSFYAMTLQRAKMVHQARQAIDHHCDIPETYVHVMGADWLTFSSAYEWNCRWLTQDPNNELFLVSRAVHSIGSKGSSGNADTEVGESNAARTAEHERIMSELLERFPQNTELLTYFLQKAAASGDVARVRDLLSRAPPASADDNRFWRFKGWLHVARKEYPLAEGAYRRALRLNPYDWHSQHELAGVMRRLSKLVEVETLEARSTAGKELRRVILALPDIQSIPTSLLRRMAAYAEACGDYVVADNLSIRIETMREAPRIHKPSESRSGPAPKARRTTSLADCRLPWYLGCLTHNGRSGGMEAQHARRTKTVRRAARRKEFVGAVTDCDGTAPTEAQYEARRKELMKECEIPPQLYEQVPERLKTFLEPFLQAFVRREQHDHAATYVSGLLSELQHKNAEAIAYLHGQDRLGLQRFLGWAEWDDAPLRMELARQIGRELGEADGVLVFDPSGFAKSGRESVGVARQWCGRLGKVENCQVAVYLGHVSGQEHALVDMRLYLPQEWTRDKARCKKAGVPTKQRRHRTRHQLCLEMLGEKGGFLPHTWLAGDDELGRVFWFRARLHKLHERYLLAVPSNTLIRDLQVEPPAYRGRGRRPRRPWQRVDRWLAQQGEEAWTEVDVRDGSKGPLIVEILKRRVVGRTPKRQEGHEEVLVVIRYRERESPRVLQVDYYLSDASADTLLAEFARVAKAEHRIEECLQRGKSETGLADYQVRNWTGWHHHQTLCLLATWFLVTETRRGKKMDPSDHGPADPHGHFPHPPGGFPNGYVEPRTERPREVATSQRIGGPLPLETA